MKNNSLQLSVILFFTTLLLTTCSSDDITGSGGSGGNQDEWLIPQSEIKDGGPGKDGIPSVDNPQFLATSSATFIDDDELVVGIKIGDEVKAYPHQILDWHEIVNDVVGNTPIALTYCPLTGSAIGWGRTIDGSTTTFGVSGLLYNTNLIPYDRKTGSNWTQMGNQCVNGELIGKEIATYQVVETTWKTWKKMFPDSKVMSKSTGFNRNYGQYPYGDYRTNNDYLIFSIDPVDNRLLQKTRVLGVIGTGRAKVYEIDQLDDVITVVHDSFDGTSLVVAGSKTDNFMVAFDRKLNDGTMLDFEAVQGGGEAIMLDQEGNQWNLFGEAISGPRSGEKLNSTNAFIGYWMAWGAFYPMPNIYKFQ